MAAGIMACQHAFSGMRPILAGPCEKLPHPRPLDVAEIQSTHCSLLLCAGQKNMSYGASLLIWPTYLLCAICIHVYETICMYIIPLWFVVEANKSASKSLLPTYVYRQGERDIQRKGKL